MDWRRVEELFHEVLEREPEDRAAFLREACDDEELQREVAALLISDAGTDGFLEAPPAQVIGAIASRAAPDPSLGRRVGDYRLVAKVASGGMGTVYAAERADDEYRQTAAVKLIRGDVEREDVLERFKNERQTLARLNHPNIARLLDGGATEDGWPYIVMEYIEGLPIDESCDARRLSIAERLALFRSVCDAVQYAHQNLVVHRDLKPSNILVDERGIPKLLDFGIAKVLAADEEESARCTRTTQAAMTPEYASPEQVRGEPVTTASDVYSLGVVLFALLTGRPPYRLGTRTPHEIVRAICEQDPARPSTVVGLPFPDESEDADAPARARRSRSDRLRRALSGDLDTIVLKAMHKEPERRYASAADLAEDIRLHLAGRPIQARGDAWTYRARKFVGRNKIATGMAALLVGVLVAGVAGIAASARVALLEARRAREEAQRSTQVKGLLERLFSSPRIELAGPVPLRTVLDEADVWIPRELAGQPAVEADLRVTIGNTYRHLGLYDRAEHQLRAALAARRASGERGEPFVEVLARLGLVRFQQGDYAEAYELCLEALPALGPAGAERSQMHADVLDLAGSIHSRRGEFLEAESAMREALAIMRETTQGGSLDLAFALSSLAMALWEGGRDLEEAEGLLREALAMASPFIQAEHPANATFQHHLGCVLFARGRLAEAHASLSEALELRRALAPEHPSMAAVLSQLAMCEHQMGRHDRDKTMLEEALSIMRRFHGDDHPEVGKCTGNLAHLLTDRRELAEAEELWLEARAIAEEHHGRRHRGYAQALSGLAEVRFLREDYAAARDMHGEALDICLEVLGDEHPTAATYLGNLAQCEWKLGELDAAAELYRRALEVRRKLLPGDHPRVIDSIWSVAYMEHARGEIESTTELLNEELALCGDPGPGSPLLWRKGYAVGLLGQCTQQLGDHEGAEALLLESRSILTSVFGPRDPSAVEAARKLAALYDAWGKPDEAAAVRAEIPR